MGYSARVFSGFSWQTALRVAIVGVGFGRIFFLARLLSPQDFGTFAIILIALGMLEATTETGINLTIIQSKQPVGYFVDSAWVISIIRGAIISLLMVVLSSLFALIYHQPELTLLIMFTATVPLIKGFINPTIGALHKNFQFSTQVFFQFTRYFAEACFAVLFVMIWPSVWSLVMALICSAVFEVIISMVFFKPRPSGRFQPNRAKEILHNSKLLTIQALLSYIVENADDLIVGKTLGAYSLGLYHNGYALTHKLLYDSAKSASYGLLPTYAKLSDDEARLKRGLFRSTLFFGTLLILGTIVVTIFAQPIVLIALGKKWLTIAPIIGVLAVAALLQSFVSLFNTYLYATKKYHGITVNLVLQVAVLVIATWVLSQQYGLLGAAWSIVLARLAGLPILIRAVTSKSK